MSNAIGPNIYQFYRGLKANLDRKNPSLFSHFIQKYHNIPVKQFDMNQQDMYGKTIAHYLIEALNTVNAKDAASILDNFLTLNVNLNIKDINGKTPMEMVDQSHSLIYKELIQVKNALDQKPQPEQALFMTLATDVSKAIVGSIDGIKGNNYLVGYPHLYECHCCPSLSREAGQTNLRKLFEDQALRYLNDIPGENEITLIGSGNLLDTISLIAQFQNSEPGATLRINLVDHAYAPNTGNSTHELFQDFLKCMKDNHVNVVIAQNYTKIDMKHIMSKEPALTLVLSIQSDFKDYLNLNRKPKVLAGIDLDLERYIQNNDQHLIIKEMAEQAGSLAYISTNRSSMQATTTNRVEPPKQTMEIKKSYETLTPTFNREKASKGPLGPDISPTSPPSHK